MLNPAAFTPLVWSIAQKMKRRVPWNTVDVHDLASAGMVGLMRGLKRYRPRKGKPGTFLSYRIHGAMIDHLRDSDHLSRNARRDLRDRQKAGKPLGPMALHDGPPRGLVLEDRFIADRRPFNPAAGLELEDVLGWICRHAGARAALVMKLRYIEQRPPSVIAKTLGISPTMVFHIMTKAKRKLRAAVGAA